MRSDKKRDMTNLTVPVRNFSNLPKMTVFSRVYKKIIRNLLTRVLKTSSIIMNEERPDEIQCGLENECYVNAVI
jgi:hypothetical protein